MNKRAEELGFDSDQELWFSYYLEELKQNGYIISYTHDVKPITLTEGLYIEVIKPMKRVPDKILKKKILPPRVYTADFKIEWVPDKFWGSSFEKFFRPSTSKDGKRLFEVIEVKPDFDQNNMTRLFKQNQAWIWDKYQIFVTLVKLPSFFKRTFTPKEFLLTDITKKKRKTNFPIITFDQFIKI